ncbi:MAG: hypothetical protein WBL95_02500 [Microcoleus sp.]
MWKTASNNGTDRDGEILSGAIDQPLLLTVRRLGNTDRAIVQFPWDTQYKIALISRSQQRF